MSIGVFHRMAVPPSGIVVAEDSAITFDCGKIQSLTIAIEVDINEDLISNLHPQFDRIDPPI